MEKDAVQDAELKEFEDRVESKRKECEERTRKNAEKRRRKKAKRGLGGGAAASVDTRADGDNDDEGNEDEGATEFTYISLATTQKTSHKGGAVTLSEGAEVVTEQVVLKAVVANDGSFLEKTKALLDIQKQSTECATGSDGAGS
jgi:hypothetical protein